MKSKGFLGVEKRYTELARLLSITVHVLILHVRGCLGTECRCGPIQDKIFVLAIVFLIFISVIDIYFSNYESFLISLL